MKHGGWVIAGLLLLMLGLEVVGESRRRDAATYGQGGGDVVCICITETPTFQMVVSSTPTGGSTVGPTPTILSTNSPTAGPPPTSTPSVTPSKVPVLPSHTPDPVDCPGYPIAASIKGMTYTVTKIYRQFVRRVPDSSRSDTITGYLYQDKPAKVWYTLNGWLALSQICDRWIWSGYGELFPESTE